MAPEHGRGRSALHHEPALGFFSLIRPSNCCPTLRQNARSRPTRTARPVPPLEGNAGDFFNQQFIVAICVCHRSVAIGSRSSDDCTVLFHIAGLPGHRTGIVGTIASPATRPFPSENSLTARKPPVKSKALPWAR